MYKGGAVDTIGEQRRENDMAQLRIPLDAQRFTTGLSWKDYLAQMGDTRARTADNYEKALLTEEERQFFSGQSQVRYALMLAENWCGDVHRNSPVLARIVEAMPNCELRVFFRDQNLDLTDCFLNNGYRSIPIMVFFDKDWNEIARWIERPHAATQRMFAIRATTLDVAPPDQQEAAMTEFRKQFQAAYDTAPDKSLWRDAVREVRQVLDTRLGLAAKK
jgi:Thioredoxin